jgi:hypothetical protein
MGGGGANSNDGAGGAENKLAKHFGSPGVKGMNGGRSARPRGYAFRPALEAPAIGPRARLDARARG